MTTLSDLKMLVARGDSFSLNQSKYALEQLEALEALVISKDRQLDEMDAMVDRARKSLRHQRSVKQIIEEVAVHENTKGSLSRVVDGPFFNVDEVTRMACKLVATQNELERLQSVNKELAVETSPRSPEKILEEIEASVIGRYSFVEIRQLVEHFRKRYPWVPRKARTNIKEILDLINVDDPRPFALSEIKILLAWGREQQQTATNLKIRLGRAFFDPKAWVDQATGFFLSDAAKKAMLRAGSISPASFQEGLFSRPTYLNLPDHGLIDPDKQYHAGKHFHTNQTTGLWWSGTRFADLTSAELQKTLEEALGELRALHIGYSEGVK